MSSASAAVKGIVAGAPLGSFLASHHFAWALWWALLVTVPIYAHFRYLCTDTAIYRSFQREQRPACRARYGRASRRTAGAWRCYDCRSWHPDPTFVQPQLAPRPHTVTISGIGGETVLPYNAPSADLSVAINKALTPIEEQR